jgi:hypothetical protein
VVDGKGDGEERLSFPTANGHEFPRIVRVRVSNFDIAAVRLVIRFHNRATIHFHMKQIYYKLDAHDRVEAQLKLWGMRRAGGRR